MGKKTGITWTNSTWNPWQGCTKVSEGCKNCYMFREKLRYGQDPTRVKRSRPGTFSAPMGWKEPRLVFTCSWSDFFHPDADPWRAEAWEIIRNTSHTYQILTKRPNLIKPRLPDDWGKGWENVWLGVTCETQGCVDRIEALLSIPAALYFVSVEPMLGPVDLTLYLFETFIDRTLDWVIVGDESGPKARKAELDWVRDLRDSCSVSGTPFFFKQWQGDHAPLLDGQLYAEFPVVRKEIDLG